MRTKFTLIVCAVLLSIAGVAQENTVTLKTTGSAETKEKAVQYALRSAIEQAFGAFISSNTEILNDELVADEITSVASGNIEKYDILSETVNEAGNSWFVTANVIVSVGKLTEFVQAKGVEVEVKGGLFAINIKQKQLNSDGEYKAILDMLKPFHEAMLNAYDYELEVGQPVAKDQENKNWEVSLKVLANANKNLESALKIVKATLSSLSLTTEELVEYKKLNKEVFLINIGIPGQEKETIGNPQSEDSYPKGTLLSNIADEFGVTINQVQNKLDPSLIKGSGKEAKLRTGIKAGFVFPKEADPIYFLRNRKSYEVLHFLVKAYLTELYGHNFNVNSSIHNYYSFPDVSVSLDKALLKSQGHAFKIEGEQSTLLSMKEVNRYKGESGGNLTDRRLMGEIHDYQSTTNVQNYINMIVLGGCITEEEISDFKLFVQNHFENHGFNSLKGDLYGKDALHFYGNSIGKYYKKCRPNGENQIILLFKTKKAFEFKDELTLSEVESLNGYKVALNKNVFSFSNGGITIKNGTNSIVLPIHPVLSSDQAPQEDYKFYANSSKEEIFNAWSSRCNNEEYSDWQLPTAAEVLKIGNQYPFPYYYLRSSDGGKTFYYEETNLYHTSNTFGDVFELRNTAREKGLNYDVWMQPNFEKSNDFELNQQIVDHWGEPYKRGSNTYYIVYKNKPMSFAVSNYNSGVGSYYKGINVCVRRIK